MRHSHPAIYAGEACMMTTTQMIRAGARGERVVCTCPASRTAIYMANRRAGYPCRIVLQGSRIYMYPNHAETKPRGPAVYPPWALDRRGERAIGPETMGSVVDLRGVQG